MGETVHYISRSSKVYVNKQSMTRALIPCILLGFVWVFPEENTQLDDEGPSFDETIEYINGKLSLCASDPQSGAEWNPSLYDTRSTIALRENDKNETVLEAVSPVAFYEEFGYDDRGYSGKGWEFNSYSAANPLGLAAKVRFKLADLRREVQNPLFIKNIAGEMDIWDPSISYFLVSLQCFNAGCLTHVNQSEVFEYVRARREMMHGSAWEDYRLERVVNANGNEFSFFVHCDETEAQRLQKAFSHLITLGGGKEELF